MVYPASVRLGGIAMGFVIPRFASVLPPKFVSTMSVGAAIGIYSAIASGMIALTGIVFSLAFMMSQFSAAYSPRLVLWIGRDPVIQSRPWTRLKIFYSAWAADD